VWNKAGQVRYISGPKRLWLFDEEIELLKRFSAQESEYLKIRRKDGVAEHVRGPAEAWFDPVLHESIVVHPLNPLDANEAVVIYERGGEGGVSRRVLRGPALYMPEPDEWLHEFSWHGADPKQPRKKTPHALQFHKLRVIPDQTYFSVKDVRTADDALLMVQVMIFFELADIEQMLDQTHDPIADFINAVTADVIDFAATRAFDVFKQDTERLNDLSAYPNLVGRAKRIGYRINKVVYRGYEANPKLQGMHDTAIEARTSLQLEAETERQAQELADLKLLREGERAKQHREMQRQQAEHEQQMKQLSHDQSLREQANEHAQLMRQQSDEQAQQVRFEQESNTIELEHINAKNAEQATLLQSMQQMQVDLTRYLVAQYQHPDRLIRIDGESARLHLHEQ
ncbi:MAG: hypothetical protein AAF085_08090, partial [Planctomycetota bacterium]